MTPPSRYGSVPPLILLVLTAVTGVVDAVSFLALGHVFTANMTGNIVHVERVPLGTPYPEVVQRVRAMRYRLLRGCRRGRR